MSDEGSGYPQAFRIFCPTETWGKGFLTHRQEVIRDIEKLGCASVWSERRIDLWRTPAGRRADAKPIVNMDIEDAEIAVRYYGGDGGALLRKLHSLVEVWRQRYCEPRLRLERVAAPAGGDDRAGG